MNITSNDRLLSLALQALEQVLVPELQSPQAQATAEIVKSVLADLIKREHSTPMLLAQNIADGTQVLDELLTMLRRVEPALMLPLPVSTAGGPLAADIQRHAMLGEELAALSSQLVERRGATALRDQQEAISALLLRAARWELAYPTAQRQPLPAAEKPAAGSAGSLTLETLQAFVRSQHADGEAVSITSFSAIPGGFGKQTSRFTLRDAAGREQVLIARKNDPLPMLSRAAFVIASEFHLLRAVSAAGYLAPTPLWLGRDVAGVDADFYVMNCLPGRIPGSFLGGLKDDGAETMLLDVATQLGRLHALPLDAFADYIRGHDDATLLSGTVESAYRREIAAWREYAARPGHQPSPFLSYIFDWLERHVPKDARPPTLLHGDFNIHNLLVDEQRVSGVLDWECAMFGAPEQDLAYIQPHISQHIEWDRFIAQYLAGGGRELDVASMPFYMAYSAMRLHIAMLRAMFNLQSGANDDVRYTMVELAFGARFMELGLISAEGSAL